MYIYRGYITKWGLFQEFRISFQNQYNSQNKGEKLYDICIGDPEPTSRSHDSWGLTGLSMSSYSWLQFIIGKGYKARSAMRWSLEETRCEIPELLSPVLNSPWHMWHAMYQSSLETLSRQPLGGTYQNSRLQERKQMFSINHIAWTNHLGAVSYSRLVGQFWKWWEPSQNVSPQMAAKNQPSNWL